jgi:hypothetical protein
VGWSQVKLGVALLASAGLLTACLVTPFKSDAAVIPHDAGPQDLNHVVVPADAGPVQECNLLQDGCAKQGGCYPDDAFSGATTCQPPGVLPVRYPCQLQSDCASGEVCFTVSGTGQECLELCRTDVPASACLDVDSTSCVPLTKYPGFGYCF